MHNETVAVDLNELYPGVWYLQIIDQSTRFCVGSIPTTKIFCDWDSALDWAPIAKNNNKKVSMFISDTEMNRMKLMIKCIIAEYTGKDQELSLDRSVCQTRVKMH